MRFSNIGETRAAAMALALIALSWMPTPAPAVPNITGMTTITSGYYHACGIANGRAYCWGNNYEGELGNGDNINRGTPTAVATLGSNVTAIAAGGYHTCAIRTAVAKSGARLSLSRPSRRMKSRLRS